MKTMEAIADQKTTDWKALALEMGGVFWHRAAYHDNRDTFVGENFEDLKTHGFFSALIPEELGGGGLSHAGMSDVLRLIGQHCGSTGLSLAMHQHLVAAKVWEYKQGSGGEDILKRIAENKLILVSTGERDWLESNGNMQKVEGGYLVNAFKAFASNSAVGDVLVTSAPYEDPAGGWQVLHFSVPFQTEGLEVLDNWYTLGMRGTGSHTILLKEVFVPDSAIVLKRPRGKYHPVWNVVLTAGLPLIMAVYVGVAEKAAQMAVEKSKELDLPKDYLPCLLGEMQNLLTTAQVLQKDMIRMAYNLDFQPANPLGNEMLIRKTIIARSCIQAVQKAMEITGGQGFMRRFGMERLFRDVQAAQYHPLQEKDQHVFTGNYLLNDN